MDKIVPKRNRQSQLASEFLYLFRNRAYFSLKTQQIISKKLVHKSQRYLIQISLVKMDKMVPKRNRQDQLASEFLYLFTDRAYFSLKKLLKCSLLQT